MTGLEKITDKIISDANSKAKEILSDADLECKRIYEECETKKAEIFSKIEENAVMEGEVIKSRSMSGVEMNKRDIMMSQKGRLIDETFAKAKDEILSMDPDKYRELLTSLLCRTMEEQVESERENMRLYGEDTSPESYEVILNKKDREAYGVYVVAGVRRATVGKITGDVLEKIHLSETTADIEGGLIIKCGDIEINCSFDVMFAALRSEMEAEISAILFPIPNAEE